MRIKGLDGREYPWQPRGDSPGRDDPVARSALHLAVRAFLRAAFPTEPILEEVSLPGSWGLRADFYLPVRAAVVEAHGGQHLGYVPHFHGTRLGWFRQQARDADKARWCGLNGLRYVALHHDEDLTQWASKIA